MRWRRYLLMWRIFLGLISYLMKQYNVHVYSTGTEYLKDAAKSCQPAIVTGRFKLIDFWYFQDCWNITIVGAFHFEVYLQVLKNSARWYASFIDRHYKWWQHNVTLLKTSKKKIKVLKHWKPGFNDCLFLFFLLQYFT